MVRTIPVSKLDRRRGEGFWTIAEHVIHLARVQPMLLGHFERFLREDRPEFVPYLPGAAPQESDPRPPRM